MTVFKNSSGDIVEIPLLGLRVEPDATFEVPEDLAYSFEHNPLFASSRVKNPDVTPDPTLAAAMTGPVPVLSPDTTPVYPAV